jgi:hypothetical protein
VKGLPKDALVEKQVLYHTGRGYSAVDDDEGDTAHAPIYSTGIGPFCSFQQEGSYLTRIRGRIVRRSRY